MSVQKFIDENYNREGGKHYATAHLYAGIVQVVIATASAIFSGIYFLGIVYYPHEIPFWFYAVAFITVTAFFLVGFINISQTLNLRKAAYEVRITDDGFEIETYASRKIRFLLTDIESIDPFTLNGKERYLSGFNREKTHYLLALTDGERIALPGTISEVEALTNQLRDESKGSDSIDSSAAANKGVRVFEK